MWTRSLLKSNAKKALGSRYWLTFSVCLVATLLGAGGVSYGIVAEMRGSLSGLEHYANRGMWTGNNPSGSLSLGQYGELWAFFGAAIVLGVLIGLALACCLEAFWIQPLTVGRSRYMMESRQGNAPFSSLFSVFRTPYLNVVKVSFLTFLKILAGYLIVVPGIIWSYKYRMIPYLLAENPYLTTARAMELSGEMMEGEKWRSFVLDLSFFGWIFLCTFTFGIGLLFLEPYYQATCAELYAALRSKVLTAGVTDTRELGGFMRYE